eukprot:1037066-Prymnesium_polylepis.1
MPRAMSEEDGGGAGVFRHGAHGRKHDASRIHESSSEHEGGGWGDGVIVIDYSRALLSTRSV